MKDGFFGFVFCCLTVVFFVLLGENSAQQEQLKLVKRDLRATQEQLVVCNNKLEEYKKAQETIVDCVINGKW